MDGFSGFPSRSDKTAIPNAFFSDVLPLIDDDDELRVSPSISSGGSPSRKASSGS